MRRGLPRPAELPPLRGTKAFGGLMEDEPLPKFWEVEAWNDGRTWMTQRFLFDHEPRLDEWAGTGYDRVGKVMRLFDRDLLTGLALFGIDSYQWDGERWVNTFISEEGN